MAEVGGRVSVTAVRRDGTFARPSLRTLKLLSAVNAAGPVFLSHTKLRGRFVLRLAIGNLRTMEKHVKQAWKLICSAAVQSSD